MAGTSVGVDIAVPCVGKVAQSASETTEVMFWATGNVLTVEVDGAWVTGTT